MFSQIDIKMQKPYPLKLSPAFKDYLWGGEKLVTDFNFNTSEKLVPPVAEAWVLSTHPDGASIVENGELAGKTFSEALTAFGTDPSAFPILTKFIDAKSALSIQVHPSDEYAYEHEGEQGKTEMWYVMDAEPGAFLYFGFKQEISKEQFKASIENDTLCDLLNKVNVKKGDCFFIPSGTIHAIGAGLLIAEIQQNSNTTYRVYDYGRVGADGKPRELHVDKAIDVTDLAPPPTSDFADGVLATCKYFTVKRHVIDGVLTISEDDGFMSLIVTEGNATICDIPCEKGASVYIPAGYGEVPIEGNAEILSASI